MKHIKIYAFCLFCCLFLSGCGAASEETETAGEYGSLMYIEPTTAEEVDDMDILELVDMPEYEELSIEIDFSQFEDMSVQEGDAVTAVISYILSSGYIASTTQEFVLGNDTVSAGFDEHLIGLSVGETVSFELIVEDPQYSALAIHEGETLSFTVEITDSSKEEEYTDCLDLLWEEFVSSSQVDGIYTDYLTMFSDEEAEEAMIATAAAYREGIDETSEEFLEILDRDYSGGTSLAVTAEIYKTIIKQKIFDTLSNIQNG